VIFGRVLEGMELVTKIEGLGSGTGATKSEIRIKDSGELKEAGEKK
jgi:peptidylprolyl isomerase